MGENHPKQDSIRQTMGGEGGRREGGGGGGGRWLLIMGYVQQSMDNV